MPVGRKPHNFPVKDWAKFIRANTAVQAPPLVPEIRLHLASEIVPIWRSTEEELKREGIDPPFWAFAWAGGQALARYIIDHPETVDGRRVLDFGSGSGLVAIAAAKAGAKSVLACDIDLIALEAVKVNAAINRVEVECTSTNLIGTDDDWNTLLVADMCYEQPLSAQVEHWMRYIARRGGLVLLGDPKRTYFPKTGLAALRSYSVPVTRELEDREIRDTGVFRIVECALLD
jgi:predicted nicotinamide N-methyase